MSKPRVVIALGGNALQKNGEVTAEAQKKVAEQVGEVIAKLSENMKSSSPTVTDRKSGIF